MHIAFLSCVNWTFSLVCCVLQLCSSCGIPKQSVGIHAVINSQFHLQQCYKHLLVLSDPHWEQITGSKVYGSARKIHTEHECNAYNSYNMWAAHKCTMFMHHCTSVTRGKVYVSACKIYTEHECNAYNSFNLWAWHKCTIFMLTLQRNLCTVSFKWLMVPTKHLICTKQIYTDDA